MSKKLTQKEVLERFKKVHGDTYDYSHVEYVEAHTNVKIICKKDGHGIFDRRPNDHYRGRGCPKCGVKKRSEKRKISQKEVLERFKKVHGDEYDYSHVEYVGDKLKVKIICIKYGHGIFEQRPNNHAQGQGCPECGLLKGTVKLTKKQVLEKFKKVHGDTYDYSLVEYDGASTKVKIICRKDGHGVFEQTPSSHLNGRGCKDCGYIKRGNSLRKTIEEFLDKAKLVHVEKYDYSLIEYVDSRTKVKIICKEDGHGIFEQNPTSHLQGIGCPKCGIVSTLEKLNLGVDGFVQRSNLVHNNFYGYEKVEYVNSTTYVIIKCPVHGDFTQIPASHLSGTGCPQCGNIKQGDVLRKTKAKFIEEAELVHGDEYDYSLVEYVDTHTNISIICKKDGHGKFNQAPNGHLHGSGCPKCAHIKTTTKLTKSTDDFVKQAKEVHPYKNYGYEKVVYVNAFTKVVIVCPVHGDFSQSPDKHLQGNGCKDCGRISQIEKQRLTIDEFIEKSNIIHNNYYGYEKVVYLNNSTKVIISCSKHGNFKQRPHDHLQGTGCPKCINKSEGRLAIILNEIGVVHRNHRINNRYFDFYLPKYNLIIERDGEQHYYEPVENWGSIEQNHQNDIEKTNLAKSKGHKICRIPYWLSEEDERKEIQNILNGQPTYPDVPDLEQAKSKPPPN